MQFHILQPYSITIASLKNLGIVLDSKLDFNIPIEHKILKSVIRQYYFLEDFHDISQEKTLLIKCKSFIRLHHDYGNILYGKRKALV